MKRVLNRDEISLARMRREIEVQSTIHHPNVMPIIESGEGFDWYAMPLASRTLADISQADITQSLLLSVVQSSMEALKAAHVRGYIHRDVSPHNIFDLGEQPGGKWVLGDWGCVRRPAGTTTIVRTTDFLGKVGFAAPEMWDNPHNADPRTDIFSLGRTVGWAVSGREPVPNRQMAVTGPWSDFVRASTADSPSERPSRIEDLLPLLPNPQAATTLTQIDLSDPKVTLRLHLSHSPASLVVRSPESEVVITQDEVYGVAPYILARKDNNPPGGYVKAAHAAAWASQLRNSPGELYHSASIKSCRDKIVRRLRAKGVVNANLLFVTWTGTNSSVALGLGSEQILILR